MTGYGKSYGAITVLNAIPAGIGATIGTKSETIAVFTELPDSCERTVLIENDPLEDDLMARLCVEKAYEVSGIPCPSGFRLEIRSEIPVSRGLKSSSSACNAILEAVFDEISYDGYKYEKPEYTARLGAGCAKKTGVSVTGAFDDACGCSLGGFVMTDNREDRVLYHKPFFGEFDVVISIPEEKTRKASLPVEKMRAAANRALEIAAIAAVRPFDALTKNGAFIAELLGEDNSFAEKAMKTGAFAAGLSGTGPAVAVLLEHGTAADFIDEIDEPEMNFLVTETRNGI